MSKSQKNSEPSAEDLAKGNEEIQAGIEERALVRAKEEGAVVVVNLQVNPMKVLGLADLHSESTLTALQMADPRFAAKVERAKSLGLIKVK